MKRSSSIVILASLMFAACGHLGSNGAMIAAANKNFAANPLCIGFFETETYEVLMQAGLGHYTRSSGSFTPSARLKPFIKEGAGMGGAFEEACVAHVVADSVASSEPLGDQAAMYGASKNALRVEFRTHINYGPWNSNSQVRSALNGLLGNSYDFRHSTPSVTLIVYDDPVKGWVVLGT